MKSGPYRLASIRKLGLLGRTYRHAHRYAEILSVLFRFGFDDLVTKLKVDQYLDLGRKWFSLKERADKVETLSRAQRLRLALEELGPTFVKMGQVLSTRPDLLPLDFIHELARLQDEVPPFAFDQVRRIVQAELKAPLEEVFARFDPEPLAAASIGQVHRARFHDGEEVVVKVQRPDITRTVEVDLEIMLHLATLMERHLEGWDIHQPTQIVEEFARTMENELDYHVEAGHLERFAQQFAGEPGVYVPKVFGQASTARVLTMEYVAGLKPADPEELREKGFDLQEIARRGADLIMKQIFVHGFFHSDPHPGNLLILPGNVICYLDLGQMGRLKAEVREDIVDLVTGVVQRDESAVVDALLKITSFEEEPDRGALEREAADFLDRHLYRPLGQIEFGALIQDLWEVTARHRLRTPPDVFLLLKALSTMENLGRQLDPDFDLTAQAAPFVQHLQMERLRPGRLIQDLLGSGSDMFRLLKELPGELRTVLRLARSGKLKIEFEHRGLDPLITTQDRTSNRLSFAIVLASLVIGSSLIIHSDIPPKWHDIPLIGLAGYLIAGLMGLWLLVSILRGGRM